ncbi:hypothetical protein [Maritimibacter dapengensis]|uniref:Uncharacterized protein n=1 Tax=Maritimibacter dapengensis TaxID=2836868 RepID=A0ABS6T1K4_9RHOB|nr:hypothetical protein [Maritimibacter dapengensis]MBV7379120.1 hypothetical protein [Maritimibacter dapengensis]
MIRTATIGAAFALMPLGAFALEVQIDDDCTDNEASYFDTEVLGPNLLYTRTLGGAAGANEWLVACGAGKAVRANGAGADIDFIEVAHGMNASRETYDFDEVAKLSRELGFTADVVNFNRDACVCGL